MATPSTVVEHSMGDLKLHIATFASIATAGEIWTSNIPGIVAVWAVMLTGTAIKNGISAGVTTASSGTVTLMPNIASSVKLFVASVS